MMATWSAMRCGRWCASSRSICWIRSRDYASGVDIIFCQNVTIYFQLKTCQELIARFYGCLPAGGLLFLGFSETLWNIFDRFHSREVAGAYVYYKGDVGIVCPTGRHCDPASAVRNATSGTAPERARPGAIQQGEQQRRIA